MTDVHFFGEVGGGVIYDDGLRIVIARFWCVIGNRAGEKFTAQININKSGAGDFQFVGNAVKIEVI